MIKSSKTKEEGRFMEVFAEIQKIGALDKIFIYIILSYISTTIFSILDVFLFDKIFNLNFTREQKFKFILISGFFKFIGIISIPFEYYLVLDFIVTIFLFKMIFNKSIEKCILGETINLLCIMGSEILFSKFWGTILVDIDMNSYKILNYRFCLNFSIIIFRAIIYYIVKFKNIVINLKDDLNKENQMKICIISIIESIIMFLNSIELFKYIMEYSYFIFLLDLVSILMCFYLGLKNIIELSTIEEQSLEIDNLETYNKTLTIMYDNIRGFKHDYANFVQSLNGYVQTNNMEGIRQMCNSVFEECKTVNNLGFLDPDLINNAPIYSIVTSKYYLATDKDITVNIEVFIDFEEIQEEIYEVCRILAILLDNAIEAAKECDDKIINIRFLKDDKCDRKLVIIENTYRQQDIDIGKIFEKGYTTKIDDNNEHGLGLWTVRKILSKSKKLNLYTTKEKLFCQKLEIYN